MKITRLILIYFTFLNFSIFSFGFSNIKFNTQEIRQENDIDTLIIQKHKILRFPIKNNDPNSFGYKFLSDDESIGVKAICIDGIYAYFTDTYHNNIKRLDLSTDSLVSSKVLSFNYGLQGIKLRDIGVFNDSVFVTSDLGTIYIFSQNLQYYRIINIINEGKRIYTGIEEIYKLTADSLIISNDANNIYSYFIITASGIHKQNKDPCPNCLYNTEPPTIEYTVGKSYTQTEAKEGCYIQNQFGVILLKKQIPKISYDCKNLDFSRKYLVYYDDSPKDLQVFVYSFK